MKSETVYMVDEIVARPGQARALLADYMERYAPGARARGLVLERVLVSPPMWLEDQSNTLAISWTLDGVPAWWWMRLQAGADPAVAAWWAEADARLLSRKRLFMSTQEAVEVLSDV